MEKEKMWIALGIFVLILFIVFIIIIRGKTNLLVNKSISFRNTLATRISSIYVQDSNFNTYPITLTSPIARNAVINIIIPKSNLNSNITSLSVFCSPTPEIQDLVPISFVLINDNDTIIYIPLSGTTYNKPTISSTFLSSSIIPPTIPPSCSNLCTNMEYPTTGYITIRTNYNKPVFIAVNTTSNTGINTSIYNPSSMSTTGATITTSALNTSNSIITCLAIDLTSTDFLVHCTIFYKLSNGKISKIVFGTSPSSIVVTQTQTPSNDIQHNTSGIPNSLLFLKF